MPQWNAVEWILRRLPEFHLLPVANDSFHFVFIVDPVKGLGCREIWKNINDKLLGLILLLFVNIWDYSHKLLKYLKWEWCAPPPNPSSFFLFVAVVIVVCLFLLVSCCLFIARIFPYFHLQICPTRSL